MVIQGNTEYERGIQGNIGLPSEMFPKYVKAVEWEKMIADRFQRPTHLVIFACSM